ncbi:MAG: S8 family serine peptidase [Thermoanaerobaculia bacterium]
MRYLICVFVALLLLGGVALHAEDHDQKVDPWVLATASQGDTEFLVFLQEQSDLRGAVAMQEKKRKGVFVVDSLRSIAEATQKPLLALLSERGAAHRPFWVANMIWVRGNRRLIGELAAREDVFHIYANPRVRFESPALHGDAASIPLGVEWNVLQVSAPDVWALGFSGQGVVVGGADTGYQWDHPALKNAYRGWNGMNVDHNYSWHDAIHSGGGSCGADSPAPCDDTNHGTHTMGTAVGDDGTGNQIGVAPGAKWIGCRNMDQGVGTPTTYSECFQWFIAPTDLSDANPDPSKAPDVINNSWICAPEEGCTDPTILRTIVENTRAAGIEVVACAGNGGGCGTVGIPALFDATFAVGATDNLDLIAKLSRRGPAEFDGSGRVKPDVCAPGVNVRSSVPPNDYAYNSGTSMASPHVAGLTALLISADPRLSGNPDALEQLMTSAAIHSTTDENCGGLPGTTIPNNTYGWGRVDALAAVQAASADLALVQTGAPDPSVPGHAVTFVLTASNAGPATADPVTLQVNLSSTATGVTAATSQGTCVASDTSVICDLGSIAAGAAVVVAIRATPTQSGPLVSAASLSHPGLDLQPGNEISTLQTAVLACPLPAPVVTAPTSVPPLTDGLQASMPLDPWLEVFWSLFQAFPSSFDPPGTLTFRSGQPGRTITLNASTLVRDGDEAICTSPNSTMLISIDFFDTPPSHAFHDFVNTLSRNWLTNGCGEGNFCPDAPVTRAQMAVFLLRAEHGIIYTPPFCTGIFLDTPCPGPFTDWIEQLAAEGVTSGCGNGNYCPDNAVTRAQMAVFLLRTLLGSGYVPPVVAQIFDDVPPGAFAYDWINDLSGRGVTGGCSSSPLLYCPGNSNTRGQMAVFIVKIFDLQ